MMLDASSLAAAIPGLVRSDLRALGITRERSQGGFRYRDPTGAEVTQASELRRIAALAIPPAWTNVWISPQPLGHVQATGVDSRGRTQYRYHQLWREQRDAQKFVHMLRFASVLPGLRTATLQDLHRRTLGRERVAASAVRLIDFGLFRIGAEKYAELDHNYGATTLQKRHVKVARDAMMFDYIAKEGKERAITVADEVVLPTVRALARADNGLDTLFSYQSADTWHTLHSHDVSNYIARRAGAHFTAKEFRTWNATVLMALELANAGRSAAGSRRKRVIAGGIRKVAGWLGDTPTVARKSYIDPRLIARYESEGDEGGEQLWFGNRHCHDRIPAHASARGWPERQFHLLGREASGVGDQADVMARCGWQLVKQVMNLPLVTAGKGRDIDQFQPRERPASVYRVLRYRQSGKARSGVRSHGVASGPAAREPDHDRD